MWREMKGAEAGLAFLEGGRIWMGGGQEECVWVGMEWWEVRGGRGGEEETGEEGRKGDRKTARDQAREES